MPSAAPFLRYGSSVAASPVVLSVPHAGRNYPMAMRAAIRLPLDRLRMLEDRHVDTLARRAHGDEMMLIQQAPRAWIDLNRAETERDPMIDDGARASAIAHRSAKMRSGLGLVPRRAGQNGDIWQRRLSGDEVAARIQADHRPYHFALAEALAQARSRFGVAILLDIHSMPSLGPGQPRVVIGDRFGQSAASRFIGRIEAVLAAHHMPFGLNHPYAGGHILERHAVPRDGIHGVQIEFDRSLYLDAALDAPGASLDGTARLLRAMIDALADEALALPQQTAAE